MIKCACFTKNLLDLNVKYSACPTECRHSIQINKFNYFSHICEDKSQCFTIQSIETRASEFVEGRFLVVVFSSSQLCNRSQRLTNISQECNCIVKH